MENADGRREGTAGTGIPAGRAPGPHPLWTGSARNGRQWLLAAAGAACVALGVLVAAAVPDSEGAAWVMAVAGSLAAGVLLLLGTVAFVRVQVRIDRESLQVRCGRIGLPRRRIPLREVVAAGHEPCTPMAWGGWGYRRARCRGTAVIVRKGPALVLDLGGGRRFTVTVDDPEGAVRVIRGLCAPAAGAIRSEGSHGPGTVVPPAGG